MKKLWIPVFCLMATGLLQAQDVQSGGFVIKGRVQGLADHSAVFVTDANKPSDTLGRGTVQQGAFLLKGHMAEPNLCELNFGSAKKKAVLFIGNENIEVQGSVNDLAALKVTGSPSHDDFMLFQREFNADFGRLNELARLANSPEGVQQRDSIATVYNAIASTIETRIDSFIAARRSSYVSPFVLLVTAQLADDPLLLERRYQSLSPAVQGSMYGKYLHDQIEIEKIGAVGTEAIDFTQNDTAGNPVSLSSYKGKYVLVDFWASWCRPCRMENPNVVAAYGKFKSKNFTVLGVSLDQARAPWVKAIHDDGLAWAQVSDLKYWNNEVAVKYHIQQIPQNLLIDPAGRIIARNLRGPELDARLCELLGCN